MLVGPLFQVLAAPPAISSSNFGSSFVSYFFPALKSISEQACQQTYSSPAGFYLSDQTLKNLLWDLAKDGRCTLPISSPAQRHYFERLALGFRKKVASVYPASPVHYDLSTGVFLITLHKSEMESPAIEAAAPSRSPKTASPAGDSSSAPASSAPAPNVFLPNDLLSSVRDPDFSFSPFPIAVKDKVAVRGSKFIPRLSAPARPPLPSKEAAFNSIVFDTIRGVKDTPFSFGPGLEYTDDPRFVCSSFVNLILSSFGYVTSFPDFVEGMFNQIAGPSYLSRYVRASDEETYLGIKREDPHLAWRAIGSNYDSIMRAPDSEPQMWFTYNNQVNLKERHAAFILRTAWRTTEPVRVLQNSPASAVLPLLDELNQTVFANLPLDNARVFGMDWAGQTGRLSLDWFEHDVYVNLLKPVSKIELIPRVHFRAELVLDLAARQAYLLKTAEYDGQMRGAQLIPLLIVSDSGGIRLAFRQLIMVENTRTPNPCNRFGAGDARWNVMYAEQVRGLANGTFDAAKSVARYARYFPQFSENPARWGELIYGFGRDIADYCIGPDPVNAHLAARIEGPGPLKK